jgi:DNA primase
MEFGMRPMEGEKKVSDFILEEFEDGSMIENPQLLRIIETYKAWYREGMEPTAKNFLYHEDQQLSALAVSVMDVAYELSPNWSDHYDGKISTREELYREEVLSTVNYLKLRKIKRMIEENQQDLEKPHSPQEQLMLIQVHQHLKQMETELTKNLGTVILR